MEVKLHPYSVNRHKGIMLNADSPLGSKGESITVQQFLRGYTSFPAWSKERATISSAFLGSCIEDPHTLTEFGRLVTQCPELNEKTFSSAIESFTKETSSVIRKLPPESTHTLTENPDSIGLFLDVHYYDPKNPPQKDNPAHVSIAGLDDKTLSMMKKMSREILKRTFDNCREQKEIVDVMYNSAVHLLSDESTYGWEPLLEILTFKSPFLNASNIQAGRYVAAELSSDEDLFMKYYWLNTTAGSLITLLRDANFRKRFDERGVKLVNSNPGFMEIYRNKSLIISLAQAEKYLQEEDERYSTDWHKKLLEQDTNDFSDLFVAPEFPYSITTRPNPLMNLTKRLIALEYRSEMQDIVSVILPPFNTAFNIMIGKNEPQNILEKPKRAMHLVYEKGPGGEISNPYTIHDALRWFRPELFGTTFIKLEKMTIPKIKKRLAHPKRSLPSGGIHIVFDAQTHPFIEASAIDIDKTGKKITLTFGAYTIPLCMDNEGHIRAQDGSPINLEPNSRSWWEAAILSTIADITSPVEGDEVLLTDTAGMPHDEAMEKTQRAFVLRGPHMRRLHPGQGFNTRRAEELLLEEWPFPHIQEPIDLFAYNGIPHADKQNDQNPRIEREEGQWTYVHEAQPKDEDERVELKQKKRINLTATVTSLPEIQKEIQTQYAH